MKSTVKERIEDFLKHEKISKTEFGRRIGVSASYIASIRKSIAQEKIVSIAENWPHLNIEWLLTGEGEMLKTQSTNSVVTGNVSGNGNQIVAGNNNVLLDKEASYTAEPKAEDAEDAEIIESEEGALIPEPVIVPPSIMQRPETDAKKWVKSREAQANADRLQIAGILKATDMVWKVEDEAMQPTLFQGEYVLIKEMDDEARIIDGRVYAIDTQYHGNLIRRVYDDGDTYRLEPINKVGFSAVTIDKEGGFNRRYRILCHLSTEISILPDVEEERRKGEEVVERRDRQINTLLEQQGELIGIIKEQISK